MDILEKITTIIAELLGIKKEEIKPEDKLTTTLKLDELDGVELILTLEEEYDISIPDEEAEKFITVQDIVNYVTEAIKKESGESGDK